MDSCNHAAPEGSLTLSVEETDLLHTTACRLVEAATRDAPASIKDYPLGRLAEQPLVGVFITLRKSGELRGCIGNFAEKILLGSAIERAASGVVNHDPRFPPVTSDELPELALSVSLLHSREQLGGTPQERAERVVVGQHGLDIQLNGQTGLLLPSVATDFGMDALGFLQAVCRKARLHDEAWQDPAAVLFRFSAIGLGGMWVPKT